MFSKKIVRNFIDNFFQEQVKTMFLYNYKNAAFKDIIRNT